MSGTAPFQYVNLVSASYKNSQCAHPRTLFYQECHDRACLFPQAWNLIKIDRPLVEVSKDLFP
jgi:hypothetical protein